MAKEFFRDTNFRGKSLVLIRRCNEIITDYKQQGLRLTLRQLYYQLVSRNVIPNLERSYKNLSSLVTDARMAGEMDWSAIEDRVRVPMEPLEFSGLPALVDTALFSYRLSRWEGQDYYVELWVEKDALAGVLRPIAGEYHITLMVNRGYSSASAMYESSKRFMLEDGNDKTLELLYLGDHDPSGEDMVRDVEDRLREFGAMVNVRKIALTMRQVKEYKPPPNPAKISDPRAADYIRKFGPHSWEVDALPPNVLSSIIRRELDGLVDREKMDRVVEREEADKKRLKDLVRSVG